MLFFYMSAGVPKWIYMASGRMENGISICSLRKRIYLFGEFFAEQMVCTLEAADQISAFGLPFAEHCAVKTQYFAPFPSDVPLLSTSRVVNFAQISILNKLRRGSGLRKWLHICIF